MDKLYAEIGARMRALRKALKLTQAQVAEAAGIDASFYGQIERGANIPSLMTFLDVAKALKAEPTDLLPLRKDKKTAGTGYAAVLDKMFSELSPKEQELVFGVACDVAGRLKK
ncbi:MAG: helix-turn-helix transcriptional regulator [Elusimicrobia bacterium]|nr:helix-turn-helix transcriptional regulator [Elusimicrobiota bacterium]